MRDPRFWLRFWAGADTGCQRKLLGKAPSSVGVKSIDPITHALYKAWVLERYEPCVDTHFQSYQRLVDLANDSAPLWKRGVSV